MTRIDALKRNYVEYLTLPWEENLPPAQRVWFLVYDPAEERRLRLRLGEFEHSTREAGYGWERVDLTDISAKWLASHEYRESYFESPEDLPCPHPDFEAYVAHLVRDKLERSDKRTVVAITGLASLFGFMRVSRLVTLTEKAIRGRMLVFFPGSYDESHHYRFLDARDGWNYHAVPITAEGRLSR